MKCSKCNNEGYIEKDFTVLEYESSDSNWDDWDQWFKLKCKECGHEFEHVD